MEKIGEKLSLPELDEEGLKHKLSSGTKELNEKMRR